MIHAPTQTPTPESLLKEVFGYEQFKPLQREVIENVLQRQDTLVIMPTGGGKSLCYQIPALIFSGLTVVVSPLIALMKDQVEQLRELGIPALFLNSSLSFEEYQENLDMVRSGKVKLLYIAPETLLTPRIFGLLSSLRLDCLTIDEAHCISEWGHDFRPEYRQLVEVRERFPGAVCIALTATATPRVREDIQNSLRFELANEFIASFNRPNLLIEVTQKNDPLKQTLEFLRQYPDRSGIIYCFSRKQVDELTSALARHGFSALSYHAGLADWERKNNQEKFIRDDIQIIVATIAFGMGINKPNVRFVIHYDLPKSIENYYQEIGRAGRDGLPAHCLLLYSYGDVQKLKYFIDQKEGQDRQVAYQHLGALTRYAESDVCRRVPLLSYFGETFTTENCGMCDVCMAGEQEQIDITIPAQKFMSCVKRTGERFGANHVADVLLGSENQKVLKFGHQNLSTYGIGKDLTRQQWHHLARQLVQKGFLEADPEYGSLRLTQRAGEALKNREPIFGTLQEEEAHSKPGGPASENVQLVGQLPHDPALFDLLRAKRKALADAARIPPYAIFPDRTLIEMATYFPQRAENLMKIHGVGTVKQERYGAIFLDIIVGYCTPRSIAERSKRAQRGRAQASAVEKRSGTASPEREETRKARHIVVGEAYNQGQSIEELVEAFSVQQYTILDHLTRYAMEGNSIRQGEDVLTLSQLNAEFRQNVLEAFAAEGVEYLRPVFDRLNGTISYDELKILRLYYLIQSQ